jgi:hypothetical protein
MIKYLCQENCVINFMACGSANSNYPDYLKSILAEISSGNDDALKACACSLRSYIDINAKPYALPYCITSVNGEDNTFYTTINNYIISQGGTTALQAIDPQKIMELQYKYKSFDLNIIGNGWPPSATCTDEGPSVEPSSFSEIMKVKKYNESRKNQVCDMFFLVGGTVNHGYLSDCDGPVQDQWHTFQQQVPEFNFHYYFFMDTYVDPECGEPGPILYQFLYYYGNDNYIPVNDYYFRTSVVAPPGTIGYQGINATNLISW